MNPNEENQNNPSNSNEFNEESNLINLNEQGPAQNEQKGSNSKKINLIIPIFGIVVILILGFILIKLPTGQKNTDQNILDQIVSQKDVEKAKNASNLPDQKIDASDHLNGNPKARLVLVEYSDLDCPYCARFQPTMKKLVEEYPNDLAWVYRHFPLDNLHKNARTEAIYSECVAQIGGNNVFWQFIDNALAYSSSSVEQPETVLKNLASVDQNALNKCLTDQKSQLKIKQKIENDEDMGKASGTKGTPFSILVDRTTGAMYPIPGAQDLDTMREIIKTVLNDK